MHQWLSTLANAWSFARSRPVFLVALCLGAPSSTLGPSPLHGQSTIASDRPGLGTGSTVIEPGMLQFELGGEYADDGEDAERISLGLALVRFGLTDGLELQATLGSFTVLRAGDVSSEGLQDIGFGAKARLPAPSDGWSWSVLGSVALPTGNASLTADEVVPAVALLSDVSVAEGVALAINVGTSGFASAAGDQVTLIVTPSFALPGERPVSIYAGYAGYYAAGDTDLHYAEAGLTWLRGSDLQLDLNTGVEVYSGHYFIGIGVARRWPTR